ncbi:FAD-linked oxidase C-terminal domain-containing protein [Streptomyces sp. NRRL S-646]|uniref:FAD-linked oxidase C-terminal domain-containing protein n=1 Tax=Streptomyces sp. NRRL S-646 TaxID=1463917 RepID=UPI0004C7170D|nr:FAD-linked oxidase C-terminal domain-containing protein [Streptomyces sp. NRRL S-646]
MHTAHWGNDRDAGSVASDQREADALFQARRPACAPRQLVPQMPARIEQAGGQHGVHIANIAQAGDGDLHPLIITDPGDDRARWRAQGAFEPVLDGAIAPGGTVTVSTKSGC